MTATQAIVPPPAAPGRDMLVTARALTKRYGALAAVDAIDLDIPRGSIFGLIGPNGAGKSTTFAMVASLLVPTSGSITIGGYDPVRQRTEVRRLIGYMPDNIGVYGDLSVEEYLRFFAGAYKIPARQWPDLVSGLLELVDLTDKRGAQVDSLSRGMKQRISLARSLVHDPELLILDEPASGLDPRARVELRELLLHLSAMGKTILISSHILAELEAVCSEIAIMESGQIHAAGAPAEIRAAANVQRRVIVEFADGTSEEYPTPTEEYQARLLHHFVTVDPRTVLSFTPAVDDLEGLYLRVTEQALERTAAAGDATTSAAGGPDHAPEVP